MGLIWIDLIYVLHDADAPFLSRIRVDPIRIGLMAPVEWIQDKARLCELLL
jgi:hypothetical protein